MSSAFKLISILLFVAIYNIEQSKCGDEFASLGPFSYNMLDDLVAKYYSNNKNDDYDFLDQNNELLDPVSDDAELKPIRNRVSKSYNRYINSEEDNKIFRGNQELNYFNPNNNNNNKLFDNHGIRDEEFLEKSSLWRHQMVMGGAGEGEQKLKPDGSIKNVQVVKTDSIIPSYCTPPNPCPIGYSNEDGCLEEFKNTASFSRDYQSMQDCMCDSEHMFSCDSNKLNNENKNYNKEEEEERELNTIARSLANQPIGEDTANQLISTLVDQSGDHKVVAKKFFIKKKNSSPFLKGEKLPIVAKKSPDLSKF